VPVELDPAAPDLTPWVGPGTGVVVGEGGAEAEPLVDALPAGTRLFVGMAFRPLREDLELWSFGATGHARRAKGLRVVPCHFGTLPRRFADGSLPGDVALVQVAPPGPDGRCSLGIGADYLADALRGAEHVVAEVNARMPVTRGPAIALEDCSAVLRTDRPLREAPVAQPTEVDRAIAAHVAALVQDGDALQLGIGGLPEAVLQAITARDLRVHSGFLSDGVLDLLEAGQVTEVLAGIALGSQRLYDACAAREDITFAPTSVTHDPARIAAAGRLVAVNGALEVSRDGEAGSEAIGGRYVGAVGGQVDFLRAAVASGGAGVLALPSERVVDALTGPTTVARADVDWVVTEHGAARLWGLDGARRRAALATIAPL
jgi:acyl-CoA hydrolase